VRHCPFADANKKLVGVLSRVDVLCQIFTEEAKKRASKAPSGAVRLLGDVMLAEIPTIHEDALLAEIIAEFLESATRRLIVTNSAGHPLGLISDADAVLRAQPSSQGGILQALRGKRAAPDEHITAAQLMSQGVLSALPDMSLTDAAHLMLSQKRKWLVVVDDKGKAIGLVDRQILFKALASH